MCCLARAFFRMFGDADDQHRREIAAVLSPPEPLARFPVMWNRSRIRSSPRERDHQVPTHGPGSRPFSISPSPNTAQRKHFSIPQMILAGPDIVGARRVDSAATTAHKSFADPNACDIGWCRRSCALCRCAVVSQLIKMITETIMSVFAVFEARDLPRLRFHP